jgi:hypothetical protein
MAKMRDLVARVAKQDASLANDLEWTYADIALQYRKPPDPRPLADVTIVFSIVTGDWCKRIWHASREVSAKNSQARILANNRS